MAGDNTTLVITVASAEGAMSSVIVQVLVSVPAFQLSVQPPVVQVGHHWWSLLRVKPTSLLTVRGLECNGSLNFIWD